MTKTATTAKERQTHVAAVIHSRTRWDGHAECSVSQSGQKIGGGRVRMSDNACIGHARDVQQGWSMCVEVKIRMLVPLSMFTKMPT